MHSDSKKLSPLFQGGLLRRREGVFKSVTVVIPALSRNPDSKSPKSATAKGAFADFIHMPLRHFFNKTNPILRRFKMNIKELNRRSYRSRRRKSNWLCFPEQTQSANAPVSVAFKSATETPCVLSIRLLEEILKIPQQFSSISVLNYTLNI